MKPVVVTDRVTLGNGRLALIGGPCAIEGRDATLRLAERISGICARLDVAYVFKASFDKANRSSVDGFRGVGRTEGLSILAEVKRDFELAVITDVHESHQVAEVAEVVDVLQIPAFLCRQTELLAAAAQSGRVVNVKKGQFLSPPEMSNVATKLIRSGADRILITERGTSFGYNDLVVDFRGLEVLHQLGWPVVFDATHSVQTPGGLGDRSGGQRQYVPVLARAAVAVGIDALFMEIHEDPDHALSDGPNMVPVAQLEKLLSQLLQLHETRQSTEVVVLAPYAP